MSVYKDVPKDYTNVDKIANVLIDQSKKSEKKESRDEVKDNKSKNEKKIVKEK